VDLTAHAQRLVDRIQDRSARIGVVGLGYVGLPTAVAYADAGFTVVGIDTDTNRCTAVGEGRSVDHGTPSADELRDAAATVSSLVRQGHEVLVHCHAGIERTPMVVCAALVILGWSLTDAYQRVLEVRPEAAPTDGQLAALRALSAELAASGGAASTPS
jgi:threonine dehydrogenase-like Zn-dependent dehydrogenase